MNNFKLQNPLKSVNIIFSIISIMYSLLLIKLSIASSLIETISSHVVMVIGFCLSISFIVCYLRKTYFAWWIAFLFNPILFTSTAITRNKLPDERAWVSFIIVFVIVSAYLLSKYSIYKMHVANGRMPDDFEELEAQGIPLQDENANSKPQNPLQAVMGTTVTLAIFELSYLFPTGKKPTNYQEILMFFSPQTFVLLLLLILLFAYHKKSIVAWWVSMIHIPVMCMVYYSFNSFNVILFAIAAFIFAIMAGYLIMKYRSYQAYISTEEESAGIMKNDSKLIS